MMAAIAKVIGPNGIGYITGQGGTVTQTPSKSSAVTLNKLCGQITTAADALAGGAAASFVFNNSFIAATDTIIVNVSLAGGGHGVDQYRVRVGNQAAGGICAIVLENITGGSLSDAVTINFAVIKGINA
jgi:hypothetical protein